MTLLALLRHAPTQWNIEGRVQGRHDPPLAADAPYDYRLPPELDGFRWLSSPLRRARDTARRLGIAAPVIEPRLVEMSWGAWEGRCLAELRAQLGDAMAEAEAQGLDFRPPSGESPRDLQGRLRPLLAEIAEAGEPVGAITHKGVIRAVLGLASGWDMRCKQPHRLDWRSAHLFRLDRSGHPEIARLNLALASR